nr:MAG: ORF1 [TTV-like mini virus]
MPPYWRARYYRQRQRRRRPRWIPRRRTRRFIQRRRWRKQRHYFRRKVKRRLRSKKPKKITVKQFQPTAMQRCKIIGYKCLFQGSTKNLPTNYIQYIYSTVPPYWPGGGGWSIIVFSLTSLFEDWEHLENIWTKSNVGLPLVKYRGCILKFYQSYDTDYIAVYDRCWPMIDTDLTHPDSCPSRMLQKKHKTVIPSRKTQPRKKPYKKIFIPPPAQMQTQWYFQRDICKLPLFMLTTTSVDLLYPFCSPHSKSNNITIPCLSPFVFQNLNFTDYGTTGYSPKTKSNTNTTPLYLYASTNHQITTLTPDNVKQLIPLVNTKDYQPGQEMSTQSWENKPENWGNPFYYHYLTNNISEDTFTIYISATNTTTMKNGITNDISSTNSITKLTGPLIYYCRYNPAKDKGDTNKMYLVSTSTQDKTITPPANTNLQIEGLPLFVLTWSWTDWVVKAKITPDIFKYRTLVIETKMLEPELTHYIPIDSDFLEGKDPYTPDHTEGTPHAPNFYNSKNWHPKFLFQQQTVKNIAMSGPAVHRDTNHSYIQAYCKYKFLFTWGGCPKQLPKPFEPCLQPKWTTANNITGRLEITNPNTQPQTELYSWDWDEDFIKTQAIKRVTEYTETDKPTLFSTANKNNPKVLIKVQEKEDPAEKEEKEIFQQLQQLRLQRQQLQLQINKCLKF